MVGDMFVDGDRSSGHEAAIDRTRIPAAVEKLALDPNGHGVGNRGMGRHHLEYSDLGGRWAREQADERRQNSEGRAKSCEAG
jgi:hypothetical protein